VDNLDDFIGRIRRVTGPETGGLHEPVFEGNEKKYLAECVDSGFVSSIGPFVAAFEESVRDFVGAQQLSTEPQLYIWRCSRWVSARVTKFLFPP
jgi:hypothetical protein